MEASKKRLLTKGRKKKSIRKRISGTGERPRVSVTRSLKHISVQAIDDVSGSTVLGASTTQKELAELVGGKGGNKDAATKVGKAFGEKLVATGVKTIIFDRNGLMYHGRVKSLADGLREAGLDF
ncbi:MAG: 50S ribosomal protein L18 [SAR324 cluster bacterium]|uniref:Large ribosomal subunit protein uL18 n=1 Tax=SAR324 cluster bacterium TaxID=2024889 RepID=A0A2A4TB40_9DELT|nr:MAG: 50S ribosomal protein L18 [SAR324 cluster bacterium]